ncbi:MAG: restriction endonuclease [Helicobacteraceae bacterium]|jgi:hypothetical protein|nr:restriction endonuclease [Helicobacteraceae bacterium]
MTTQNENTTPTHTSGAENEKRNIQAIKRYWGKEYEKYIYWLYTKDGYTVDHRGGFKDEGIDLIATKHGTGETVLIQCKYWKDKKSIRKIVIVSFFGAVSYIMAERKYDPEKTRGVLIVPARSRMTEYAISFFAKVNAKNKDIKPNVRYLEIPMRRDFSERKLAKLSDFIKNN